MSTDFQRVMHMPPVKSSPSSEMSSVAYTKSLHDTLGVCESKLSLAFFSDVNTHYLQTRIIGEFHMLTGIAIGRQRKQDLLMLMRYVFVSRSMNVDGHEVEQLRELNKHVVHTAMSQVATSVEQHFGYLRDASGLPTPMARSVSTTTRGESTTPNTIGF